MKRHLPWIFLLAIVSSCKKQSLPADSDTEPEFFVRCNDGSQSIRFEAGNSGYYMHAEHQQDSVRSFLIADLRRDCERCDYGLKVLIHDYSSVSGAAIRIDDVLKVGEYFFQDTELPPQYYNCFFVPELPAAPGETFIWKISDGNRTDTYSTHSFSTVLSAASAYTVTLSTDDPTGCETTHTSVVFPSSPQGTVQATRLPGALPAYRFTASLDPNLAWTYFWDFGDGTSSHDAVPEHTYTPVSGYYTATLTAISGNDTCRVSYHVPGVNGALCTANFNTAAEPIRIFSAHRRITLLLTDPNGTVFTSEGFSQPPGSSFRITEVENYRQNERQEPTRRFQAEFSCTLRSSSGEVRLRDGVLRMAVSYR